MKIIEGAFAGTIINYKETRGTRVTTDKVRKAVFDVLKNMVEFAGLKVADLFCGSGMYGMESLSRGCGYCVFVDNNRKVVEQLKENIKILNIEYCRILNISFDKFMGRSWGSDSHTPGSFDLVFADPPYYQFDFGKFNEIYKILNTGGIFVLESSKRIKVGGLENLELIVEKRYGDTVVRFYRTI